MKQVRGGYNTYGFTIGVLVLKAKYPRIPGDLANASSYGYPVRFRVVEQANYQRLVIERDPALLQPFIEAAQELESEGVKAVTTSCGFLALFQKELAASVDIPVFTSSLMLVPMVSRMLGPRKKVGIMSVNASALGEAHYAGVGWSSNDYAIVVAGMENEPLFLPVCSNQRLECDVDQMEAEMVTVAKRLVAEYAEVGAIVLECTSMQPYAPAVQEAVGLPVFHIFNLVDMVYGSFHCKPYEGYM